MVTCPSCSREWPDGDRFCMDCGTPLIAAPPIAEERRVVTVFFCDLVGFTALSEAVDPGDVAALLSEYSRRTNKVIESHGGTVARRCWGRGAALIFARLGAKPALDETDELIQQVSSA